MCIQLLVSMFNQLNSTRSEYVWKINIFYTYFSQYLTKVYIYNIYNISNSPPTWLENRIVQLDMLIYILGTSN